MNNKRKIFIGSRKSNLAKEQTNLVIKRFKKLGLESFFVKYITKMTFMQYVVLIMIFVYIPAIVVGSDIS